MRAQSYDRAGARGIIFLTMVLISVGRIAAASRPEVSSIPVGHDPGGLGVEGSLGDNLFGIPLTILSTAPSAVCL